MIAKLQGPAILHQGWACAHCTSELWLEMPQLLPLMNRAIALRRDLPVRVISRLPCMRAARGKAIRMQTMVQVAYELVRLEV
eukprot:CAMPEP_0180788048 /NCGR_PEP_ID=MMETSP1038_2-20121128/51744_1 /TAXON_ID=632150 /ORGANISM="Azadinium spinosum, Strain 3D9" /LENGTH=81 /DNA_ID=CAMNT_0022825447 /DNA_START=57 /DNA_END=299 /DNA_ORIENTATION=-